MRWREALRALGLVLLSSLLSGVGVVVAVAMRAPGPLAVAAGAVVGVVVVGLATLRWARGHGAAGRGRAAVMRFGLCGGATLALGGWAFLVPADRPDQPVGPGIHLSDGVTLGVRTHRRASGAPARPPVVVVHGGPGAPLTRTEERVLVEAITDRMIVVYDQVGAGRSTRLERTGGYTARRAVDDLAEVVDHVAEVSDSPRVTLLGYSWGAAISVLYAAEHPERVAGLAFLSPGALPLEGSSDPIVGPQSRLGALDRVRLNLAALRPRNLFIYALTAIDGDAAHWFVGDSEADARYTELFRLSAPGLSCDQGRPVDVPEGLGHFANQMASADPAPARLDTAAIERLQGQPVLVLRGECDYLPREQSLSYRQHLPASRLIDVGGAGHALLGERPEVVSAELRKFLSSLR
jgi:pimeloyl-ACP methyl ester carboxylesterase